jgi:hypothetical protein
LSQIVGNEALTRGLEEPESRILVEWLVERAEHLADLGGAAGELAAGVARLCRRARSIVLFVRLWCHEGGRRGACQLAAAERFGWPLPTTAVDPCELMQEILHWESQELDRAKVNSP